MKKWHSFLSSKSNQVHEMNSLLCETVPESPASVLKPGMVSPGHDGNMQGFTSEVEPAQLWMFCLKHDRLRTRNKLEPQVLEHWDHGPHSVKPSVEFEETEQKEIEKW